MLLLQPQGPVPQNMEVHMERGEAAVSLPGVLTLKFFWGGVMSHFMEIVASF